MAQLSEFLDASVSWLEPMSAESPRAAEVQPALMFIPGQIFGSPDSELGYFPLASIGAQEIGFPLYLLAFLAEEISQPLTVNAQEQGLSITPEDARLLRIATFFFWGSGRGSLGAGLRETGTDEILILVYVDRACAISGTILMGDENFPHDLSFESAGFHLLRLDPDDNAITNFQSIAGVDFYSTE
jgi:hypothetical protein